MSQPMPFNIPGLSFAGSQPNKEPMLLVIAREKYGKSSLSTTLFGWPTPQSMPLVLAFDQTGPDSCAKFGYQVPCIKPRDVPGSSYLDKCKFMIDAVEKMVAGGGPKPSAIVTDCVSTMVEKIVSETARTSNNPDTRSHYKPATEFVRDYLNRMREIGVPTVLYGWLREPFVQDTETKAGAKGKRMILGGVSVTGGQARDFVGGKPDMILILDKRRIGIGQPGTDEDGYVREFHTRTWSDISAGGRYSHLLPDPCPAHLGGVLSAITGIPMPQRTA